MQKQANIYIGTSGWHYEHWRETFYPVGTGSDEMLPYYADRLGSVEINNSFYNLPAEKTFEKWRETVPEGFVFAVKASRYITHMKKLKDPEEPVRNLLGRAAILGSGLGPVLFQLPPRWQCNPDRLGDFLARLPPGHRYAFEFRDNSWFGREVYCILGEANAAFCIYDLAGSQSPRMTTADFVYIRLHGPGDAYEGSYDTPTLSSWAGAIASWAGQGLDVYCYFDNDQEGFAVRNALELQEMVRNGKK